MSFRDSLEELRDLICTKFKNVNITYEAELKAVSFGLFLALRLGFPKVIAQTDSLEVV